MNLPNRPGSDDDGPAQNPPVVNLGKTTIFNNPVDCNVANAIAYLPFGLITVIASLILLNSPSQNQQFNRYHAMQSLVFSGAVCIVMFLVHVVLATLAAVPLLGLLAIPLGMIVPLVLWLGYGVFSLKMAYETLQGKSYRMPYLAKYVDQMLRESN